jgi:hypothetical protein
MYGTLLPNSRLIFQSKCVAQIIETKILPLFIYLQMYQQINEDTNEVDFPATEKYFTDAIEGVVGWSKTIADALNSCETAATCI